MSWKSGIVISIILCILTVIVCIVIADEVIGIEGTVGNAEVTPDGSTEFTLNSGDPAGRIVFWCGLLILPLLFVRRLKVRYTLINFPLYFAAWYLLDAIFGNGAQHGILSNHMTELIHSDIFSAASTAVMLWGVQAIEIFIVSVLCSLIKKTKKSDPE